MPGICTRNVKLNSCSLEQPFQSHVAFYIEISHLICLAKDWFIYETQHLVEML